MSTSQLTLRKTSDRRWDWLSVILLVILLEVAAARLVATLWTIDLNLVIVVTFLGTILGLALGKSIFHRFWVFVLAFAYGVIIIPWQLGLTLDQDIAWNHRLINLWGRLNIVIQELLTRKPITDNLLFLLLMALLFWALSTYAGVVLLREGNPWKVIIPAGVSAFVINSFDSLLIVRSLYLAVYLLFALLLVARAVYIRNTSKWTKTNTHTPPDIGFDLSRVTLILAMLLVFFAWNVPVLADTLKPVENLWQQTSRPWLSLKDRFSFMFASLQASATTVHNFYSDTLPLGLGSSLSDQVIMEVQGPTDSPSSTRYYWLARTYDTYNNYVWSSSILTPHDLTSKSKDLTQPGVDVRTIVTFTFKPYQPISNIYTVSEPLWSNISTQAYMQENQDGTVNFSAMMTKGFVKPGEIYDIKSAIDSVTVKQLKDAGSVYPQWVLDDYLQLPNNITVRTKELAKSIAAGQSTPYDAVNAVTQYLRDNIEYDQSVSQPPVNQERVDWFLFDYKKGFCNYYASAEVVLLRSLGIPARLAVGFAQGQQAEAAANQPPEGVSNAIVNRELATTSTFVVRQKDAHAWPEVFFPGIGWVIFEPTVSQVALSRPSGETANPSFSDIQNLRGDTSTDRQELGSEPQLPTQSPAIAPKSFWTTGNVILFGFILLGVGFLFIFFWQSLRGFRIYRFLERISVQVPESLVKTLRRLGITPPEFLTNWIYYMKLPAISRSYLEINHALERVGKKPLPNDTPTERTGELISAIPALAIPATLLLSEYQASVYSHQPGNLNIAREAANEIRSLSWREWVGKYISRFRSIGKRK